MAGGATTGETDAQSGQGREAEIMTRKAGALVAMCVALGLGAGGVANQAHGQWSAPLADTMAAPLADSMAPPWADTMAAPMADGLHYPMTVPTTVPTAAPIPGRGWVVGSPCDQVSVQAVIDNAPWQVIGIACRRADSSWQFVENTDALAGIPVRRTAYAGAGYPGLGGFASGAATVYWFPHGIPFARGSSRAAPAAGPALRSPPRPAHTAPGGTQARSRKPSPAMNNPI